MAEYSLDTERTEEGDDLVPDNIESRIDELLALINTLSTTNLFTFPSSFSIGQFLRVVAGGDTGYQLEFASVVDTFTDPVAQTGDFTAADDGSYYVDAGSTVTLPAIAANKRMRFAPKSNADLAASSVTLDKDSGDSATFKTDGGTTYDWNINGEIEVYSQDGSTWEVKLNGVLDR